MNIARHIIIGTGPAGVVAAETLRQHNQNIEIILIGNESEPPYSRMAIPYYLSKNIAEQGTYLRKKPNHYQQLNIQLLQAQVVQLQSLYKRLVLQNGKSLYFDKLLIASGSKPIKPPIEGLDLPAVQTCWTLSDARNIARYIKPGKQVVLMGAGFIGCIVLEALAKSGAKVTVIEKGDRMVPRMMNEKAGNLIKQWCQNKGIRVLTSTGVTQVRQGNEQQLSIETSQGQVISADLLVCATGVQANIDFLTHSSIETDHGVLVNSHMQTNIKDIYAAGDVAQALDFSTGRKTVQAIQPTAVEHARIAALNMLGHQQAVHHGSVNMNVLDTLGLISTSFGLWMGDANCESAELYDSENYRYINLQFYDDILIGATTIGFTEHVGVIRGLIQNRTRLGKWKSRLLNNPSRIMEAWLENRLVLS